ncbi:MAG: TetR/AcrR family transcriptional regulator [Phycisphaerales bacterium JB054]
MGTRSDGNQTKHRLLEAAIEIFAKRGFREARVSDICEAAGAAGGAVNYHFGSKEHLYLEVWESAWREADREAPMSGGDPGAPPEDRLKSLIRNLLHRILVHGPRSRSGRLLLQEMRDPVEAVRPLRRRLLRPAMDEFRRTIEEIGGMKLDDQAARHCHMSVLHQCLAIGFRGGNKPPMLSGGRKFTRAEIDYLVDHVTAFSIGGIRAIAAAKTKGRHDA